MWSMINDTYTNEGLGTFHGMGIAAITPRSSKIYRAVLSTTVTAEDIARGGSISIQYFEPFTYQLIWISEY